MVIAGSLNYTLAQRFEEWEVPELSGLETVLPPLNWFGIPAT
jgi:hypothetical protein